MAFLHLRLLWQKCSGGLTSISLDSRPWILEARAISDAAWP